MGEPKSPCPTCGCRQYSDFGPCAAEVLAEERGREVERLKSSAPEIVSALGEERIARKQAEAEVERLRAEVQNDYKALWEADSKKLEQAEARLREVVARHVRIETEDSVTCAECEYLWPCPTIAAAQPEEESHG